MAIALRNLYSDSGAAIQGWRTDLTKEAQTALKNGNYILKDGSTSREVMPWQWERTVKPGKRFWLKFTKNKYLNMNNEQLYQLERERSKPSMLNRMFK